MGWAYNGNTACTTSQQQNNANIMINYYRGLGWDDNSIAALLGNIANESGFNPHRQEVGGKGYGLVQWTPKSVLRKHVSKALGRNDYPSGDAQMRVIPYEIQNKKGVGEWYSTRAFIKHYYNSGANSSMIGITGRQWETNAKNWGADKLAVCFMACYERPSYNPSTNHYKNRMKSALEWLAYMGGEIPDTPYEPDDPNDPEYEKPIYYLVKYRRNIIPLLKAIGKIR